MKLPDWTLSSNNILIAPLNWGLGHASRCIPIIENLIGAGKQVFIASDGEALKLLKKEFPKITTFHLPPYNISYDYNSITVNILIHSGNILKAVHNEKKVTKGIISTHDIDTIISDNRYGVRNNKCKNVIICHQLSIQGKFLAGRIGSRINAKWINKFDECWIPDNPPPHSLAGKLSNPARIDNYHYIGNLSRMQNFPGKIENQLLVILSGPEPKRSELEEKLVPRINKYNYTLVRGVIGDSSSEKENIFNYLTSKDLNKKICATDIVICRAGYSSIMDLYKLKKKAILIPTPGQTEQEYLASHIEHVHPGFKVLWEKDIDKIGKLITDLQDH